VATACEGCQRPSEHWARADATRVTLVRRPSVEQGGRSRSKAGSFTNSVKSTTSVYFDAESVPDSQGDVGEIFTTDAADDPVRHTNGRGGHGGTAGGPAGGLGGSGSGRERGGGTAGGATVTISGEGRAFGT
jgi:hypothetical protein